MAMMGVDGSAYWLTHMQPKSFGLFERWWPPGTQAAFIK